MKQINICHMTTVHPRTDTRIILKECSSLAMNGWSVSLLVNDGKGREVVNGVEIEDIKLQFKSRILRIMLAPIKMLFTALSKKADVYHFHDPELIPVGLVLRLLRKKVIYDAHEDVPRQILTKTWIPIYLRRVVSSIFELLEDFSVKRFSHVFTATDFITKRFSQKIDGVTTINNYPLLSEFISVDRAKVEQKSICYIGGITRIRGIKELVKALEYVGDVKLYLAGIFESDKLKQEITTLEGWKKVEFLGFANRKSVCDVFSKSRVGILPFLPVPNHIHSSPNKMFEYMSAGLPIIATNFEYWVEIVEKNRVGVCAMSECPEKLAEKISFLLNNESLANELGKNGKKLVDNAFNWNVEEKKMLSVYSDL